MCTEFTYVNLFCLKKFGGPAKAQTTLGHPCIAVIHSSMFGEDWWKIEGGTSGRRNRIFSLSLRYGDNCKSGKNSDGKTLNPKFGSARLLPVRLFVILPGLVTFCPELKENIPNNKNVCYVYINKIC